MRVVILTYNRLDCLKKTVNAWLACGMNNYVVVNNGSTDGTKEWLDDNNINAIHLHSNVGIAKGMITGYESANDDWYLFVDEDITPNRHNVLRLFESAAKHFGQTYAIGAKMRIPRNYRPAVSRAEQTKLGIFHHTTHVSGCRAMSNMACKMLLSTERDINRYRIWRDAGYFVGYATWINVTHFGENDGVQQRGMEYIF
jgi:glycosyltransferase involved in cell wall biosynthesis